MVWSAPLIWFLVGVVFMLAEMLVPGFILVFFTAGSWIAAISLLIFNISLPVQLVIFIVSSLVLLFTLRKYSMRTFRGTTAEKMDDAYAESKIGKTAIVTQDIAPGKPGEIKMMGSFWRAVADREILSGESVEILSKDSEDGLTYRVK